MSIVLRAALMLFLLVLGGCTAPPAPGPIAAARAVVEQYIHNGDAKTAGPLTRKTSADLEKLSDADHREASALLEQGALGFSIFIPDFSEIIHTSSGPIPDMIKLDRIVFVRDGRVVGDFKAR